MDRNRAARNNISKHWRFTFSKLFFDELWPVAVANRNLQETEEDDFPFVEQDIWQLLDSNNDEDLLFYEQYLKAQKLAKERQQRNMETPQTITVQPSQGGHSIAAGGRQVVKIPRDGFMGAVATKYAPPEFNCTKGATRDLYFQVRHRSGKPSFSGQFKKDIPGHAGRVLRTCLLKAWSWHIGSGSEQCPFIFECED